MRALVLLVFILLGSFFFFNEEARAAHRYHCIVNSVEYNSNDPNFKYYTITLIYAPTGEFLEHAPGKGWFYIRETDPGSSKLISFLMTAMLTNRYTMVSFDDDMGAYSIHGVKVDAKIP